MSYQYIALQGESGPNPPRPSNRRVSVRYQCGPATPGRVTLVEKQEFQRAWVLDLSKEGIGLLVGRPLEAGLHIIVQLKYAGKVFELPARVVHCTQQPGGDQVVGCELLTKLTAEELDAILQ